MLATQLPKYLYKFRNFESAYHINILTKNELFFSSPTLFNDPFDCKIPIDYHSGSNEEKITFWERILKDNVPNMSDEYYKTATKDIIFSGRLTDPNEIESRSKYIQTKLGEVFGIFSTSATFSEILLWSHYSHSHTGFLIGFDSNRLRSFCQYYMANFDRLIYPLKVQYSENYPQISAYKHTNNERFEMQILTKAISWNYEKEYRIILQNGANNILKIPDGIITRVVLGCEISNDNKNEIIAILKIKKSNISLFQSYRSQNAFKLRYKKVDL